MKIQLKKSITNNNLDKEKKIFNELDSKFQLNINKSGI